MPQGDSSDHSSTEVGGLRAQVQRLQHELATVAGQLGGLLEMAEDAIVSLDAEQRITLFNRGAERAFGYTAAEALGKPIEMLLPERYAKVHAEHVRRFAVSAQTSRRMGERGTILGRRKDGTEFPAEAAISKTLTDGSMVLTAIIRDITERLVAEADVWEREELFRLLAEHAQDMIYRFCITAPGKFVYVSPACTTIFGATPEEFYRDANIIARMTHPDDRDRIRLAEGPQRDRQTAVYRIIRSDKTVRWVEASRTVVRDASGHRIFLDGVVRDVTERMRVESDVIASERRFRMLAEHAQDLIYRYRITDPPGYEYVSPSCERITGYAAAELLNDSSIGDRLVHPEDQRILQTIRANRDSFTKPYVLRYVRKDGATAWIEHSRSMVYDESGHVVAAEGIARDITERMYAEEEVRRQAEILRSVKEAIVVTDRAQKIVYWNEGATKLFGYEREEMLGVTSTNLYGTVDEPNLAESTEQRVHELEAGREYSQIMRGRRKDGSSVWIDLRASALKDGRGSTVGFMGLATDITERVRALEAEREQQALIEGFLSSTPNAICVVNEEMHPVLANRAFLEMFAISLGPRFNTPINEIVPVESLLAAITETLRTGQAASNIELTLDRPEGPLMVLANIFPVGAASAGMNQPKRVGVSLRDVTQQRAAQEQFYQTSKLASIGEMAAGVAHELNNPLTSVLGYADLLDSENLDPETRQTLGIIKGNAERAAGVVKNLLAFARPKQPQRTDVDVHRIIDTILGLREYEMRINNVVVAKEYAQAMPELRADPSQLEQVFLNLIVNAEQAMLEAHGKGTLVIRTEYSDRIVRVSFIDDGPGIPPGLMPRLFNPFVTTKAPGKGTGLGLSIVKSIVQEHNGTVRAASEPGRGAAFVVELPLAVDKTNSAV